MTQTLTDRIRAIPSDPKAATVLMAGFETFLQYGLKRATMQDIADRAGMSRPALYLLFRNKDDIFAAFMEAYFTATAQAVEDALAHHDNDASRALNAAFEAQIGDAAEAMMRSAHAAELLSEGPATSPDVNEGRSRLAQVYARWIDAGVMAGRIAPDAVIGNSLRTAQVMLAGFDGLKGMVGDWSAYVDARRQLARLYARALTK